MAYADYEFYTTKYYGSAIPNSQSFDKQAERASDYLDRITFNRLVDGLPENEREQTKIKKAVCALADKLYGLELAEKTGAICRRWKHNQRDRRRNHGRYHVKVIRFRINQLCISV